MNFRGADVTELDELVADLTDAATNAAPKAVAVTHRAANNIQRDARDFAPSGPTTPAYPSSITYDLEIADGVITAEIGPDKDRSQGALGNILEYGTSEQAPQPHVGPAFDREIPAYVEHLEELGADIRGVQ